jgi:hypothetical protein
MSGRRCGALGLKESLTFSQKEYTGTDLWCGDAASYGRLSETAKRC